jgi:hypothetical protein
VTRDLSRHDRPDSSAHERRRIAGALFSATDMGRRFLGSPFLKLSSAHFPFSLI